METKDINGITVKFLCKDNQIHCKLAEKSIEHYSEQIKSKGFTNIEVDTMDCWKKRGFENLKLYPLGRNIFYNVLNNENE
jgi:hypothetical protein